MTYTPADYARWIGRIDEQRYWPLDTIIHWSVGHIDDDATRDALFQRRIHTLANHIENGTGPKPTIEGDWVTVYQQDDGALTAQPTRRQNFDMLEVYQWSRTALIRPWDWPHVVMVLMGDEVESLPEQATGPAEQKHRSAEVSQAKPAPPISTAPWDQVGGVFQEADYLETKDAVRTLNALFGSDPAWIRRDKDQWRKLLSRHRQWLDDFMPQSYFHPGEQGKRPNRICLFQVIVQIIAVDYAYGDEAESQERTERVERARAERKDALRSLLETMRRAPSKKSTPPEAGMLRHIERFRVALDL